MKYGLGTWCHNAQGEIVYCYIENINLPWQIRNGIRCHNGEKRVHIVKVDYNATEEEEEEKLIRCLYDPEYERTQVPATYAAASLILIDKIAYAGQDLADGFREKVLNPRKLDFELLQILRMIRTKY